MRSRILLGVLAGSMTLLAQTKPTLYIAGDTTAKDDDAKGWGDPFIKYFDLSSISVENRAVDGASARTFLDDGAWHKIVENLTPEDFVLIQFGRYDGGTVKRRGGGDLPGLGTETERIETTAGHHETVHTFGWYLRRFVDDVKARGAHPILLSPVVRDYWKDGQVEHEFAEYGKWTREVAATESVPFLDAGRIIAERYQVMGAKQVNPLFTVAHTHTNAIGADLNASLIVGGLRGLKGAPLDQFLSDKGRAVGAIEHQHDAK